MQVCYVQFCDFGQLVTSELLKNTPNRTRAGIPVCDNKEQY